MALMMRHIHSILMSGIPLLLGACGTAFTSYPRTYSYALKHYKSTNIGKIIEGETDRHPGKSRFNVIRYGREAFTARIVMTDLTDKTLDIQYYLWDQDETSRLLDLHTLHAADRGVKMRILLDDICLLGNDNFLATMGAHPNPTKKVKT